MNKADEGIKTLKDIKSITRLIEHLQEEIDSIYSMLTSTTIQPKDVDVQTSGSRDPMADKMSKILEYQQELQAYQSELCRLKTIAIHTIKQMSIDNQQIIVLKYFKCCTIEQIGDQIGYTYRWAWERIHEAELEFISIYEKST